MENLPNLCADLWTRRWTTWQTPRTQKRVLRARRATWAQSTPSRLSLLSLADITFTSKFFYRSFMLEMVISRRCYRCVTPPSATAATTTAASARSIGVATPKFARAQVVITLMYVNSLRVGGFVISLRTRTHWKFLDRQTEAKVLKNKQPKSIIKTLNKGRTSNKIFPKYKIRPPWDKYNNTTITFVMWVALCQAHSCISTKNVYRGLQHARCSGLWTYCAAQS